jgi:hypothetical protein
VAHGLAWGFGKPEPLKAGPKLPKPGQAGPEQQYHKLNFWFGSEKMPNPNQNSMKLFCSIWSRFKPASNCNITLVYYLPNIISNK